MDALVRQANDILLVGPPEWGFRKFSPGFRDFGLIPSPDTTNLTL